MRDLRLPTGVVPPCARYRRYQRTACGSRRARCADCGERIEYGESVIEAGLDVLEENAWREFHPRCYWSGAPWRRAAAERAKKAAFVEALREYEP